MRTIGCIESKFDDEGTPDDLEYLGGYIVQLTRKEAAILRNLQRVMDGCGWDMQHALGSDEPKDVNVSDLFLVIYKFVITKFAVNDLANVVSELDSILTDLEGNIKEEALEDD